MNPTDPDSKLSPTDPDPKGLPDPRPDPETQVRTLLATLTRFLTGVAILALVFTAVNVTLFATVTAGIPWPIAILLDPMVALTLTAVLYADARLAALSIRPPGWSTALRWGCGLIAALLNTWSSIWPSGHLGWPRHADAAGIVLHMVPPLMLIGLTETVAAYRRTLTNLTANPRSGSALSTGPGTHRHEPQKRSAHAPEPTAIHHRVPKLRAGPRPRIGSPASPLVRSATALDRTASHASTATFDPAPSGGIGTGTAPPHPPNPPIIRPSPAAARTDGGHVGPQPADSGPTTPPMGSGSHPGGENPANGDLFTRALVLDAASRALSGRGVSIRRLRTELHLGPRRAHALHDRIQRHRREHPDG